MLASPVVLQQTRLQDEERTMIDHQRDMTPVVDLTRKKGTGAERAQRPIYVDLLPPCNNACPAGEEHPSVAGLSAGGTLEGSVGTANHR